MCKFYVFLLLVQPDVLQQTVPRFLLKLSKSIEITVEQAFTISLMTHLLLTYIHFRILFNNYGNVSANIECNKKCTN